MTHRPRRYLTRFRAKSAPASLTFSTSALFRHGTCAVLYSGLGVRMRSRCFEPKLFFFFFLFFTHYSCRCDYTIVKKSRDTPGGGGLYLPLFLLNANSSNRMIRRRIRRASLRRCHGASESLARVPRFYYWFKTRDKMRSLWQRRAGAKARKRRKIDTESKRARGRDARGEK